MRTILGMFFYIFVCCPALAQETPLTVPSIGGAGTGHGMGSTHSHPPQDEEPHEKFYSTWYMPDNPARSCCNKADCYPTEIEMRGGKIYARRREDGKMILVPEAKIERNRDNPDGRNHICAPAPTNGTHPLDTVFCFTLGGGI